MNDAGIIWLVERMTACQSQADSAKVWNDSGREYQAALVGVKDNLKARLPKKGRTREQNDKFQPMLRELAQGVSLQGRKLNADQWRGVFTAAILGQELVPNPIDPSAGFIALSRSSKELSKEQASEMIELIYAVAAEHGVTISDPEDE